MTERPSGVVPTLVLALLLLLAPAGPAHAAAAAAAGKTMTVTAGFGGRGLPGSTVPVRVRIAAEGPVAGSLEVSVGPARSSTSTVRLSRPVDVPGGNVSEELLLVPAPFSAAAVDVRLVSRSGALLARQRAVVEPPSDEELVGLLPGVLAGGSLPGPAPLSIDAGVARFFLLDEALMGEAPGSLESLGTVGVPADGLRALRSALRSALLQWVAAGGRLLVDVLPGTPVQSLPDAWQPGPGGRAEAVRGEVVATGGAMAAGRWAGLVEPTLRGASGDASISPRDLVSQSLAYDAGITTHGASWLAGFLVLYVVVVGPVTLLVLRRRRREELAWGVVPLLAVLFATGSYVEGRRLRAAGDAHATVIVSAPEAAGGSAAFSFVGLVAHRAETARLRLPRGWSVRASSAPTLETAGRGALGVAATRAGPEVAIPLASGQMGVVLGSGPVPAGAGLSVTASVKEGRLTGTVSNGTPFALGHVAVVVGTRAVGIGELGPGAQRTWTMDGDAPLPSGDPIVPVLWPGMPVPVETAGTPAYGLWQALQAVVGPDQPAPGRAMAVAWTRDWRPALVVNGRGETPRGRTMVLAFGGVGYESGAVPSLAVARRQVRGAGLVQPGFPGAGSQGPGILRFRLPEGATPGALQLRTLSGAQVDVWSGGAWRRLDAAPVAVDDASLPEPVAPGAFPVVPAFPPKAGPGAGEAGGSRLVDHALPAPGGRDLFVRVQAPDVLSGAGSSTWLRGTA